jgi:hypothetical protein
MFPHIHPSLSVFFVLIQKTKHKALHRPSYPVAADLIYYGKIPTRLDVKGCLSGLVGVAGM